MLLFQKLGKRMTEQTVFTTPAGEEILKRGYPEPSIKNPVADNPDLRPQFASALSDPALWRRLDREHRFGVVYLGGPPAAYRPLMLYLSKADDWVLFHIDHHGVAFVRKPAEPWTIAELDAIRAQFSKDRRNDQVAFLSQCVNVLIELGDLANAERYLDDAFKVNPDRPEPWTAKAVLAAKRQQWPDAESAASHALQLEPNSAAAKYVRAQALFAMNKAADAFAIAEQLLKSSPKDLNYLLLYSKAAHGTGDYEEEARALEEIVTMLESSGASPTAYRIYLGQALSANGKSTEALAQFEKAMAAGDLDPMQRDFATNAIERLKPAATPAR